MAAVRHHRRICVPHQDRGGHCRSAGDGGCVAAGRHVKLGLVGRGQGFHAECLDCGLKRLLCFHSSELPVAVRKYTHLSNLM